MTNNPKALALKIAEASHLWSPYVNKKKKVNNSVSLWKLGTQALAWHACFWHHDQHLFKLIFFQVERTPKSDDSKSQIQYRQLIISILSICTVIFSFYLLPCTCSSMSSIFKFWHFDWRRKIHSKVSIINSFIYNIL